MNWTHIACVHIEGLCVNRVNHIKWVKHNVRMLWICWCEIYVTPWGQRSAFDRLEPLRPGCSDSTAMTQFLWLDLILNTPQESCIHYVHPSITAAVLSSETRTLYSWLPESRGCIWHWREQYCLSRGCSSPSLLDWTIFTAIWMSLRA